MPMSTEGAVSQTGDPIAQCLAPCTCGYGGERHQRLVELIARVGPVGVGDEFDRVQALADAATALRLRVAALEPSCRRHRGR